VHSGRRGGVLSPRTPTASWMALQCSGWRCGGGDDRTGPMATEEMRPAGLTSRHSPGQVWNRRSSPLSRVPPSSFEGMARRPYESGRHSVAELTPTLPHSVVQWRGWPHRGSWRNSARA
jgi:hypothetical protein